MLERTRGSLAGAHALDIEPAAAAAFVRSDDLYGASENGDTRFVEWKEGRVYRAD